MPITIDASAAAAWLLPDEASAAGDDLYKRALQEADLFQAPALWAWEAGNLLHMACRRGRLTMAQASNAVRLLRRARIRLDAAPDEGRMIATLDYARRHGLSFYDASYLEQALRTGAELATKDASLRKAAAKAGLVCLPM